MRRPASHHTAAQFAEPFDLVAVSLSKGLGAPIGSMLAGRRDLIERAVRYRRMFGGAMRQAGLVAAAGLYALDHHMARLVEDHDNARRLARRLLPTRASTSNSLPCRRTSSCST